MSHHTDLTFNKWTVAPQVVACNVTAHITLRELSLQSGWVLSFFFHKKGDARESDGHHKTMQHLNLGPSNGLFFPLDINHVTLCSIVY